MPTRGEDAPELARWGGMALTGLGGSWWATRSGKGGNGLGSSDHMLCRYPGRWEGRRNLDLSRAVFGILLSDGYK